ncbi:MAG: methyltransferase family protein [Pyrinomonadaceae bacterium]
MPSPAHVALLYFLWLTSERFYFAYHERSAAGLERDRSSFNLVRTAVVLGAWPGLAVGFTRAGRFDSAGGWLVWTGISLLLVGVALRWTAILTLRKFFTSRVTLIADHRIVRRGLYRRLRHPSYTGYLLVYLGLSLALANWASLLIIMLPTLAAILYRIRVEEQMLRQTFGTEYDDYARRTKRLLPGIY